MDEQRPPHRSEVEVSGAPAGAWSGGFWKAWGVRPGAPWVPERRPGPATAHPHDGDDHLAALRARVVLPVVTGLLSGDELDDVRLSRGAAPHEGDVWVEVLACGEVFVLLLDDPDLAPDQRTPHAMAGHLADQMEDWVCETAFAWGQRRTARYALPAPDGAASSPGDLR